jgi:hypothetical protein
MTFSEPVDNNRDNTRMMRMHPERPTIRRAGNLGDTKVPSHDRGDAVREGNNIA